MKKKGQNPDLLVMTATPIPRTLAMTVYGDLDVSVIDEMPKGRMPVETRVFPESARARVYRILEDEVRKGRQAFIVYPLVEESEKLDLKDATRMAEHLQKEIFPDLPDGSPSRPDEERGEGVDHDGVQGRENRRPGVDDGHRGWNRYPECLRHGRGACGTIRTLSTPPAERAGSAGASIPPSVSFSPSTDLLRRRGFGCGPWRERPTDFRSQRRILA